MPLKKLFILFITTVFFLCAYTQTVEAQIGFGFEMDSVKAEGTNGGLFPDIYNSDGVKFKNDSAGTNEFIWIRTLNVLPGNEWESAICDINLCHAATTDSAVFIMNQGGSGTFYMHFYPSTGSGLAYMSIEVSPINDRSKKAVLHGKVQVYDALNSVNEINTNQLVVFPNPSMDGHYILTNNFTEDVLVETYTLSGQKLKETNLLSGDKKIDLSDLSKGIYIIRVRTTRGTYHSRISKL